MNDVRALTEMALVYEALNRPDRALSLYNRSLEINPRQPDVIKHVSLLKDKGTAIVTMRSLDPAVLEVTGDARRTAPVAGGAILAELLAFYGLEGIEASERDILHGAALAAAELPEPEEGAAPPGAYTCC